MKDYTKPQELLDFTTTEEQENIITEEMLSDVLGKVIKKLNELEARILALEMSELIGVALSSFGAILAVWIRMTNDVTKIKARIFSLEKQENEVKALLKELCIGMQEIKILLAEKGIK